MFSDWILALILAAFNKLTIVGSFLISDFRIVEFTILAFANVTVRIKFFISVLYCIFQHSISCYQCLVQIWGVNQIVFSGFDNFINGVG